MRNIILAMLATVVTVHAADNEDVKRKAVTCAACHGTSGVSVNDLWPNLAGQKTGYIQKQLKAFRDGTRVDPLMSPVARMLTEEDVQQLAAYFAGLK